MPTVERDSLRLTLDEDLTDLRGLRGVEAEAPDVVRVRELDDLLDRHRLRRDVGRAIDVDGRQSDRAQDDACDDDRRLPHRLSQPLRPPPMRSPMPPSE